jgi:uncharacterized protein (DUF58 family)
VELTAVRPTHRGLGAAVLAAGLLSAGLLLGNPVLRGIGGFAAGALAVAILPSFVRLRPTVERTVQPVRLQRGERATARLVVRNDGDRRQPAFTGVDRVGDTVVEIDVPALAPGAVFEHRFDVHATRRGRIDVGPLTIERADPLGLARSGTESGDVRSLWVHPRRLPARAVGGGRLRHHHEGVVADRPLRGAADIRSLREYVPGDELRHVHWRASARSGRLVVREYVDPVQPHCTVVLDNGPGTLSPAAFEEAVDVAASVLWAAVGEGHRVTLCTAEGDALDADHVESLQRLLDRLADVEQADDADLGWAADVTVAGRVGQGGWLVVVTGAAGDAGRLTGLPGFAPVTVFDLSGEAGTAVTPGVVSGDTAEAVLERWNGQGSA